MAAQHQVYPQPGTAHPAMAGQPPVHNTTVVLTQPTAAHPKMMPQNIREWSSGICSCCEDCAGCLCGCCCMCCMLCTITARMQECCCVGCCPLTQVAMRTKVRAMYGISGGICTDSICMSCCFPLAVCQIKRELDHYGL